VDAVLPLRESAIDLAAVVHIDDEDEELRVRDAGDHSPISDSVAPETATAAEWRRAGPRVKEIKAKEKTFDSLGLWLVELP